MSDIPNLLVDLMRNDSVPDRIVQGTVVSTQGTTSTIRLQGDTTDIAGVRSLVPVYNGDNVWVLRKGTALLIIGKQGTPRWPNIMEASGPGSGGGASLVNATGDWPVGAVLTTNHRKYFTDTQILVTLHFSGYVAAIGTMVNVGFKYNSTDVLTMPVYFNVASSHQGWSLSYRVGGLAAGLHSWTMRAKTTGTVSVDLNDWNSMVIEEIPAPQTT